MARVGRLRTWIKKFLDIFFKGIPHLLRLLRLPKLLYLIKTTLRLKLIVIFAISVAAALLLGTISGWLNNALDSKDSGNAPRTPYVDFRINVDEIAQRLNDHELSPQNTAVLEKFMNSRAKFASEHYYLITPDGSVVAKSLGADAKKINVFSILQARLSRELDLVLEDNYLESSETAMGQDIPQQSRDNVQTPETPQAANLPAPSVTVSDGEQGPNQQSTNTMSQDSGSASSGTEEQRKDDGTSQPEPDRVEPRYVYLTPVSSGQFQGYVVGYINQDNYRPITPATTNGSKSNWFNQLVIGIGTFFLVFFYFTKNILQTIEDISKTSRKIAKGDFQVRVTKHSQDELGELADHINLMVSELEESIENERQSRLARDELITSASHDLRTPLTSMLGYLELLRNDQRSEQEKKRFIEIAYNKTQRLKNLVDDLFEFTKSSSHDLKLNTQSIDLCELFRQLLADFEPLLENNVLVGELDCPEELSIVVDPEKIVRVFENLISNAIRYGKEGKKIVVKVQKCHGYVKVEVTNFGDQIPAEELDKIFHRFYRIEKSRSEQTGGSGLGLAIAKNLVERHDGSIAVESNEHQTTFRIELPLLGQA